MALQVPLPTEWIPYDDEEAKSDAWLLGKVTIAGVMFHVEAIRVVVRDGVQSADDPIHEPTLDRVYEISGAGGPLDTVSVPGHEGDYVVVIYPHER